MGKEKKKNGKHEQYRNYWQHQWEASGAMSATLLQARSCAGHRDYRWLNLSSCRHEAQRYYNRLGSVRVLYGQLANIYQGQWAATILSSHHRLATGTCETTMDIFALKRVPSGNRDKMGHLHGGTELRKCEVQCQGGKLFTACDSRRGSARGRMSAPGSALLAGQISKMWAKRKQCHLEDEWTASLAAAEARLRCLAWHQTSVFLRQGAPHLTHPVWCHGCSYNTISFGQFPRGGRRMEISYRMP